MSILQVAETICRMKGFISLILLSQSVVLHYTFDLHSESNRSGYPTSSLGLDPKNRSV